MDVRMDGRVNGWIGGCMCALFMDGWMDACVNGWMGGCGDGWMDGWGDGWMGGWMDG